MAFLFDAHSLAFLIVPSVSSESSSSMEVLEIAAGGGQGGGVVSRGSGSGVDPMVIEGGEDYLQGEDSEIISAFSGMYARV